MIQLGKSNGYINRKIKSNYVKRKLFISPSKLKHPLIMKILKVILAVVLGRVIH